MFHILLTLLPLPLLFLPALSAPLDAPSGPSTLQCLPLKPDIVLSGTNPNISAGKTE